MTSITCSTEGCERKVLARSMCSSHYSMWHRANNKPHTATCQGCGKDFPTARKGALYCGRVCAAKGASATATTSPNWTAHLDRVRAQSAPKPPPATQEALREMHRAARSDLRAGYEDGDYERFRRGLLERVDIDNTTGCWNWAGRISNGYPVTRIKRAQHQVHRMVIETREGKPLGVLHAHHRCGNSGCVNPDHLQPVTHRENVAEMMARKSLEARIAELESAVRELAPEHDVLNRISATI